MVDLLSTKTNINSIVEINKTLDHSNICWYCEDITVDFIGWINKEEIMYVINNISNKSFINLKRKICKSILDFANMFMDIPLRLTPIEENWQFICNFNNKHPECKLNYNTSCYYEKNNPIYLAIGENDNHYTQIEKYMNFLKITNYDNKIEPKWYKLKYTFVYD